MKFLPDVHHCVYWVLAKIWTPNSSHKIGSKFFIDHCQSWKGDLFVCENVWFFRGWILIRLTWNLSRFVPNSVEILTWNFRKKLFRENFFRKYVQIKAFFCQNLWNFALLFAILFWVRIVLKKFTEVLSYVICTQVRRHVQKLITKRRYGEGKSGRFVFEKPVLFTLGLGLITRYSLGVLVWFFYQTFITVSIEFWLRFEPHIRPTTLWIKKNLGTARDERKVCLCVKLFDFFVVNTHLFDLKFVAFCPKFNGDSYVEFQEKTISGEFFINFFKPRLSSTKTSKTNFVSFQPSIPLISCQSYGLHMDVSSSRKPINYIVAT